MAKLPQSRATLPTSEATVPVSVSIWFIISMVEGGRTALPQKVMGR